MKTTIILITVALLTTAASPVSTVPRNASQRLAEQIIAALKNGSPEDYAALFPTIAEFHALMDNNSSVYGEYLTAAKEEFAARYENEILPKVETRLSLFFKKELKTELTGARLTWRELIATPPRKILSRCPSPSCSSQMEKNIR